MAQTYNFQTPRDLFEKLTRDSEKLDLLIDGDNLFNFISTANHLQDWIKKSPLKTSTTIKRFLKKLNNEENLKICNKILNGDSHFEIHPQKKGCQLKLEGNCFDVADFKNEIIETYELYFKLKG